jgi:hypothetical protein
MAGYSGTPLVKKLGIKADHRVALINPPADFEHTLGELPAGVMLQEGVRSAKPFDVIVFFVSERARLIKKFGSLSPKMTPACGLWIAWPKRTSGLPTDLTENNIRDIGLQEGLVDNKVCAVDDTWSGLRFVIRLKDRR